MMSTRFAFSVFLFLSFSFLFGKRTLDFASPLGIDLKFVLLVQGDALLVMECCASEVFHRKCHCYCDGFSMIFRGILTTGNTDLSLYRNLWSLRFGLVAAVGWFRSVQECFGKYCRNEHQKYWLHELFLSLVHELLFLASWWNHVSTPIDSKNKMGWRAKDAVAPRRTGRTDGRTVRAVRRMMHFLISSSPTIVFYLDRKSVV